MTLPAQTWKSYMQGGLDATWNTFPTISHRWPIYSVKAKALAGRIRPKTMDGTMDWPNLVAGMQACELEIQMPVFYEGMGLIWDWIMGTATYGTKGGIDSGSNPYTHTWTAPGALLNSMSFEIVQGNIPTGKCLRCIGMKVSTAELKVVGGIDLDDQIARLTINAIGYALTENATPTGSITSNGANYVMQKDITVLSHIAAASTVPATLEMAIKIDNALSAPPFLEGAGYISEPQRKGRPMVTLDLRQVLYSRTAQQAFLANSGGAWQVIFYLAAGLQLQFDGGGAMKAYPDSEINDEGWIEQRLVYEPHDNGSNEVLALTSTNAQALITT